MRHPRPPLRSSALADLIPLAALAALVAGCHDDFPPPPAAPAPTTTSPDPSGAPALPDGPAPIAKDDAASPPGRSPGAKAGEMCGGIAAIRCAEGLVCRMQGPKIPDQAGVCGQ